MRNPAGILVVALVGLHCSTPADPVETSEPALEDSAEPPAAPSRPAPVPGPEPPAGRAASEESVFDLSGLVHDGSSPHVTSKVTDATSATYVTGTFVGRVQIGDAVIRSRGDQDVFLVKISATRTVVWVRAVGSAALESSPRVSLEDEHRVTVIGMTKGEMDCGEGTFNTWNSSTFFVCIFGGADGATLTGGVFPTGNL